MEEPASAREWRSHRRRRGVTQRRAHHKKGEREIAADAAVFATVLAPRTGDARHVCGRGSGADRPTGKSTGLSGGAHFRNRRRRDRLPRGAPLSKGRSRARRDEPAARDRAPRVRRAPPPGLCLWQRRSKDAKCPRRFSSREGDGQRRIGSSGRVESGTGLRSDRTPRCRERDDMRLPSHSALGRR